MHGFDSLCACRGNILVAIVDKKKLIRGEIALIDQELVNFSVGFAQPDIAADDGAGQAAIEIETGAQPG